MKKLFLLIVLCSPAFADTVNLGYTVTGTGGLSGPVSGFSASSFWWADNTGTVDVSTLYNTYGYHVFEAGSGVGVGSVLISNPFTMNATSTLTVDFSFFSADNLMCFCNYGVGALLQDSHVVAIFGGSLPQGVTLTGDLPLSPN